MQTILGANGVIGNHVARTLPQYTDRIRLVSRTPEKVNPNDELFAADLNDPELVKDAVKGSDVAYLTAGLPYNINAWSEQWPRIMSNVINACKEHGSKLVFFDNVYMYGKVDGWMTEETPYNPVSKKGEVRAKIADMLMNAVERNEIKGLIARSADFYGPNTPLSFVNVMVLDRLAEGKSAQWMVNADVRHSLTYTPDAGRATAILGNTESAYNQVWHVPTDPNPLTGRQIVRMAAEEFGVKPKITVVQSWMLGIFSYFNRIIKESMELLYQSRYEYLFDSSKFNNAFNYTPATYKEGISETVRWYKEAGRDKDDH